MLLKTFASLPRIAVPEGMDINALSIHGLTAVVAAAVVGIRLFTAPVNQTQAQNSMPTVNSVSLNGVIDDTPQRSLRLTGIYPFIGPTILSFGIL